MTEIEKEYNYNDIPMPKIPLWRRNDIGNAIYEFCIWYLYNVDTRGKIGILLIMPLVLSVTIFTLYIFATMLYMIWDMGSWPERFIFSSLTSAGIGCYLLRYKVR